jgi:beta-glucanase (GH16 family)
MRAIISATVAALCVFILGAGKAAAAPKQDDLPKVPADKAWKLVWSDEFDGYKVDETKWVISPDAPRKDGWWMSKTVVLDGKGNLALRTIKEGDKYAGGCARTRGKFEHAFGYYVCRAKFHKQPGHWPAFWITGPGVSKVGDGGRDGAEIDIMEKPWLDGRLNHALHWDGYGKDHKSATFKADVPGVMDGYHTFSLWWTPTEYIFYVDGKETWRTSADGVCQVPEYMLLSDEIGKWGGDIKTAQLPDECLIDYVRVYDLVEAQKP